MVYRGEPLSCDNVRMIITFNSVRCRRESVYYVRHSSSFIRQARDDCGEGGDIAYQYGGLV